MLFYQNSFGINLLFMAFVVVVLLLSAKRDRRVPAAYFLAYVGTAVAFFFDPTGFKILIHFIAFIILVGKSVSPGSSLYLSWFMGLLNMGMASLLRYMARFGKPKEKKPIATKSRDYIKGGLAALVLIWIFALLYRQANPVFEAMLERLNFSFLSFPWVFFGYVLFLHLQRPYTPHFLIELDKKQSDYLLAPETPYTEQQLHNLEGEQRMGCLIFGALNLLLLFFLITDGVYLAHNQVLSNAVYSQSVHQGVYALILSIVCAIAIILYFFRGALNFMGNKTPIKGLTYSWIGLNVLLVCFTCYKNYQYVEALGLTYKRVGVFVFLVLALTGLITATIKVAKIRSFMYLVRANCMAFFAFLLLSACIPWDRAITAYNLAHLTTPDITYLLELGTTNADQLYRYVQQTPEGLPEEQRGAIEEKYRKFREHQAQKSWQECTVYTLYIPTKSL
jgi:hypothetical protein